MKIAQQRLYYYNTDFQNIGQILKILFAQASV